MSTATATDLASPILGGKATFLLRRLHSLTGLVFGGYLIVHLLINATILEAGHVYQMQVDKIHSLPFLGLIEWGAIFLPIIFHTVYGIVITLAGQQNAQNYPYGKNIFYVLQRISGIVIVLFILFHVLALKYGAFTKDLSFDPHNALKTVATHFDSSWLITGIVYPLGILASCYHLANGFWTAAITWGLTVSAASQRRCGYLCTGLFVVTFIAGMTALISGAALNPASMPDAPVVP